MSVEAPWLDAPAVDDAEPWKSAPVVENKDAPWGSAPVVQDTKDAHASPVAVSDPGSQEYQDTMAATAAAQNALFGPGSIVGGNLLVNQLAGEAKARDAAEAKDILAKVQAPRLANEALISQARETGRPVIMVDGKPTLGTMPTDAPESIPSQLEGGILRGLGTAGLTAAEGVARLLGASGTADVLGKDVASIPALLGEQTKVGKVGSGIGGAAALLAGGGLPGMLGIGGAQAVAGGYDTAYANAIGAGHNEETARAAAQFGAFKSAVKSVPELAAYWLLGAGAAKAVAPLVKQAGPLTTALVGGAAATAANVATSTALRGIHGEELFTPEGLATDATFGFLAHGLQLGKEAVKSRTEVRELLKSAPLDALEAAASDPQFRKSAPYDPKLIDAELARRSGNVQPLTPDIIDGLVAARRTAQRALAEFPEEQKATAQEHIDNIDSQLEKFDPAEVKASEKRASEPRADDTAPDYDPEDIGAKAWIENRVAQGVTREQALKEQSDALQKSRDWADGLPVGTVISRKGDGRLFTKESDGNFRSEDGQVASGALRGAKVVYRPSEARANTPEPSTPVGAPAEAAAPPESQGEPSANTGTSSLFKRAQEEAGTEPAPTEPTPVDNGKSEGPGAASAAEPVVDKPAEPAANDWTQATVPDLKTEPTPAPKDTKGPTLGAVPQGFTQLVKATDLVKAGAQKVVSAIRDIPKFHDLRKSILNWSARNQASTGEILKAAKEIQKSVPDKTRRDAITNWIQAGGDTAELARRAAASTDLKLKKGYQAALTLTPAEQALAGKIRQTYDILLKRANDAGINVSEIENYVNQIWKRQPLKEFAASSNRKLSTSIRFAKQRYYDSFFHGEQAGLKPETKDIAKLLPIYMNEVNNAISAKRFVSELAKGKASDGRPLLAPRGGAKVVEGDEGGKAQLVFPEQATKDTADYKVLEQPALHGWKWVGTDENGVSTLAYGDLAVHPEAFSHLKNVLGHSALREWYRSPSETIMGDIPKAAAKFLLDDVQQIAKATMLGFVSPFHQVQEGTHAVGHRVNPFGGIPKIDLTNPAQLDAAKHGLMLLPDRVSANQFREGLDGSTRNIASNLIGMAGKPGATVKAWADGYQNYLFHDYIPGLKLKTYEHILDRNTKRYVDELANGQVTPDQIKYLSAQQSNAAYGHLNYADMGRNPTIQHLAQIFLLAPDFLEARGRFTGQAAKGTVSKVGREQLGAILTLAVTQYVAARALNQIADKDPHWDEPFGVIAGNRKYTMRSVPEDIYKATTDTRKFVSGRLSPIVGRGLLEGLSGVNYRGEPTTVGETFTNIMAGAVPLTLQPATRGLSETGKDNPVSPIEQLIGSLGLHVSRFSPVSEIYHLSKDWTEKHGAEYGLDKRRAVFPISKFQQLRYALEDADNEKAKKEVADLLKSEKITPEELEKRFKMSIHHPFTGTLKTDEIFKKSLDERGKKVFDAAIARRALLIERFQALK